MNARHRWPSRWCPALPTLSCLRWRRRTCQTTALRIMRPLGLALAASIFLHLRQGGGGHAHDLHYARWSAVAQWHGTTNETVFALGTEPRLSNRGMSSSQRCWRRNRRRRRRRWLLLLTPRRHRCCGCQPSHRSWLRRSCSAPRCCRSMHVDGRLGRECGNTFWCVQTPDDLANCSRSQAARLNGAAPPICPEQVRGADGESKWLVQTGDDVAHLRAIKGGALDLSCLGVGPEDAATLALVNHEAGWVDQAAHDIAHLPGSELTTLNPSP